MKNAFNKRRTYSNHCHGWIGPLSQGCNRHAILGVTLDVLTQWVKVFKCVYKEIAIV